MQQNPEEKIQKLFRGKLIKECHGLSKSIGNDFKAGVSLHFQSEDVRVTAQFVPDKNNDAFNATFNFHSEITEDKISKVIAFVDKTDKFCSQSDKIIKEIFGV